MEKMLSEEYSTEDLVEILIQPNRYMEIPDELFAQFMYFGITVYGETGQESLVPTLMTMYKHFIDVAPSESRSQLYQAIVSQVSDGELSVNTISPFIFNERNRAIVSQAVIDLLMFLPVENPGDLEGAKGLISALHEGNDMNRGAILGGLLLTGDRRVVNMLSLVRQLYAEQDVINEMVKTQSGIMYKSVIEFYLDWLEKLNSEETQAEFGSLASGLVLMTRQDQTGTVMDVHRNFGLVGEEEPLSVLNKQGFGEYMDEILPRMRKIAEQETGTKVMPIVIEAWQTHRENLSDQIH